MEEDKNIIHTIHLQLSEIEQLVRKDLENKTFTVNYFICEESYKFLDKSALVKYITETKIENPIFLTSINKRCKNIVEVIFNVLTKFPKKKFKEPLIVFNRKNEIIEETDVEFHAIYLTKDGFHVYRTEKEKEKFIKDYSYNKYDLLIIARKCNGILNVITLSCPETKIEVTNLTKAKLLLLELNKYGFRDLDKVKEINEFELIKNIASNKLPYQIAYLEYLGFVKILYDNYCDTFTELHKLIAKILNTNERLVGGNINGLKNEDSKDRGRYTAYKHIESVKDNYQKLK